MRVRTLLYLCRLGMKNLWHNRVYSAASVITMSACIFLFGIFYLAVANVDALVQKTERDVYVSVFFDEDVLPGRGGEADSGQAGGAADGICVGRGGLERI